MSNEKLINKSREFVSERQREGMFKDMGNVDWDGDNVEECNPMDFLGIDENEVTVEQTINILKKPRTRKIKITYNSEYNNYDYCVLGETTHDGTYLFTHQLIQNKLEYILSGSTYNNKKYNIPTSSDFAKYDVEYIIGDVILHRDFGIKNTNGHNWDGETDTVAIPISMKLIENY